jgi:citrate synthase
MSFQEIQQIMAEVLSVPVDAITRELKFNDIREWDSLNHVNLMLALEERYGIEITEDSIIKCTSVEGICELAGQRSRLC